MDFCYKFHSQCQLESKIECQHSHTDGAVLLVSKNLSFKIPAKKAYNTKVEEKKRRRRRHRHLHAFAYTVFHNLIDGMVSSNGALF